MFLSLSVWICLCVCLLFSSSPFSSTSSTSSSFPPSHQLPLCLSPPPLSILSSLYVLSFTQHIFLLASSLSSLLLCFLIISSPLPYSFNSFFSSPPLSLLSLIQIFTCFSFFNVIFLSSSLTFLIYYFLPSYVFSYHFARLLVFHLSKLLSETQG